MSLAGHHVARRYARAILEIGIESGTVDALVEEITAVAQAYASSAELRGALEDPLVSAEAKRAIVNGVADRLGIAGTARSALLLLADRRRLIVLPAIAQALKEMNDLRKGVVRAEVTTAVRLGDAYYARLQAQLEKMTGKKVVLDRREDPGIIGGVVTRIGDTIIDGSLRARLDEMKQTLLSEDNLRASAS